MPKTKAGIALIVFQRRENKDLDGVLKDCADAGYACIETGFLFDLYSPEQIRNACKKHGLEYAAGHGGYDTFCDETKLSETIKNVKVTGGHYIICSGIAPGQGLEAYRASAKVFNRAGKMAKDAGLTFCYHNHAFEFEIIDGQKGIHLLGEETDPGLVKFNVDVSWVQIGRESPAEFIKRYSNRVGYYHFKDAKINKAADLKRGAQDLGAPFKMENITWTELGKGDIKLAEAYQVVKDKADYIIYEEDVSQIEIGQAIRDSRAYLRKLGI
ncbi:MAG: sugar phosphate isomerase/epimerase [Kiritimatiellaeota bacterium]|nr:sugar phosphate isomerase/epimerase [Kiritimatiellota bacterium]